MYSDHFLSNGYWILFQKKRKKKEIHLGSALIWLIEDVRGYYKKILKKKTRDKCPCGIFYVENVTREWQRLVIWTRPAE